MNDPQLLTRLLQKSNLLPDEGDFLAEGNKVLPVEALSSENKKFLNGDTSFVVQTTSYKGGKGKEKGGKFRAQEGKSKARWLPPEPTSFDLLMLPLPDLVNREDRSYHFSKVPAVTVSRSWSRTGTGPLLDSTPNL